MENENENNKLIAFALLAVILAVVIAAILYGLWAFTLMELNPKQWSESARYFLALFWSVAAVFTVVVIKNNNP